MSAGQLRRVIVSGRQLEALDIHGDLRLAPLVLLHEGLGSLGLWRDFPGQLREMTGRRVVAYSRHGHGRSAPSGYPRVADFFAWEAGFVLPEVLRQMQVSTPVLIGHSDGGSVALAYGARFPVAALVTMAAHVFVEDVTLAGIVATRERYVNGDLRERMARHHDDPDAVFWGWCNAWLDPNFRSWTLDAQAASVVAPALVIQGVEDPYGTVEQVARIVAAVGSSARSLLVPGGHNPHFEATEQVLEAVAAFCSSLP